jgi:hypothetical protein
MKLAIPIGNPRWILHHHMSRPFPIGEHRVKGVAVLSSCPLCKCPVLLDTLCCQASRNCCERKIPALVVHEILPEFIRSTPTKAFDHSLRRTSRKGQKHEETSAHLPVHIVGLDCVPITPSPPLVDVGPANDGDRMAVDHENGFSVPVCTCIIPHSIQTGDVVSKSGCGWIRHLSFSKDNACAVSENQLAFVDLLVAWLGTDSLRGYEIEGGSRKAR